MDPPLWAPWPFCWCESHGTLSHMPRLPIEHPALSALIILAVLCLALAVVLMRVRHESARAIYKKHFAANRPRERVLFASIGFYIAFASVRVITHAIHAGRGPFRDVSMGGRHIHHLVWGILLLLLVGYCWLFQPSVHHPRTVSRILSFFYGVGSALTLDEFALWLNLRDVYWERQGRASVDAVLLFGALLSISFFGGRFFHELIEEALGRRRREAVNTRPGKIAAWANSIRGNASSKCARNGAARASPLCSQTAVTTFCIPATSACSKAPARSATFWCWRSIAMAACNGSRGRRARFIHENDRAELACALQAVDAVTFFDEDTPRELIAAVLPDILVKGADWAHFIAGREEVEAAGGKVMTLPLEPGYSTSGIVEEILARPR